MSTSYLGTFHCPHGNYGDPTDSRDVDVFNTIRQAETILTEMLESNGRYSVLRTFADGSAVNAVTPLVGPGDYFRLFPFETDASEPGYVGSTEVLVEAIISGEWQPHYVLTVGPRNGIKIERK